MMLAPAQNKLQPIPEDVQPAVSQNVQRNASPADIQTAQSSQSAQQQSVQSGTAPEFVTTPSLPENSFALWIALIAAILIAGGVVWLWRSL